MKVKHEKEEKEEKAQPDLNSDKKTYLEKLIALYKSVRHLKVKNLNEVLSILKSKLDDDQLLACFPAIVKICQDTNAIKNLSSIINNTEFYNIMGEINHESLYSYRESRDECLCMLFQSPILFLGLLNKTFKVSDFWEFRGVETYNLLSNSEIQTALAQSIITANELNLYSIGLNNKVAKLNSESESKNLIQEITQSLKYIKSIVEGLQNYIDTPIAERQGNIGFFGSLKTSLNPDRNSGTQRAEVLQKQLTNQTVSIEKKLFIALTILRYPSAQNVKKYIFDQFPDISSPEIIEENLVKMILFRLSITARKDNDLAAASSAIFKSVDDFIKKNKEYMNKQSDPKYFRLYPGAWPSNQQLITAIDDKLKNPRIRFGN